MKIGIFSRTDKMEVFDLIKNIIEYLNKDKIEVQVDSGIIPFLPEYKSIEVPLEEMISDIVIVIGGDGTILKAQNILSPKKIPVLSVNMGTVGFLTEVDPDEVFECLDKLLSYNFFIEERMQINMLYNDEWKTVLNEAVLMTSQPAKMLDLEITVDDELADKVRADGLIISTPSGSTAYAMSAGGPIVDPRVDVSVIIPICPFKLNSRPKIVPGESTIKVKFLTRGKHVVVALDGVTYKVMDYMDELVFKKSEFTASFIKFENKFYQNVNNKLSSG